MQYKFEKPIEATVGTTKYQCTIRWRNGEFVADEPENLGGKDTGPDPFTLLLSSLASCTLITLRMYIDRKGWDIQTIEVKTNLFQTRENDLTKTTIDQDIVFPGSVLSTEQKDRLEDMAKNCPVSKIIEGNTVVRTFVYHEEPAEKTLKYSNEDITVLWRPELCKHSGRCVTQLPQVFNLKTRPWINAHGADSQTIIDQVNRCPTGALAIEYHKAQAENSNTENSNTENTDQ